MKRARTRTGGVFTCPRTLKRALYGLWLQTGALQRAFYGLVNDGREQEQKKRKAHEASDASSWARHYLSSILLGAAVLW